MTVLVHWLGQGLALALATACALRVLPGLDARARHAVWWGTLLAVLALPLALALSWGSSTPVAGAATWAFVRPPVSGSTPLVLLSPPAWVGIVLATAWMAVALVGLVRIALGVCLVRRIKRASWPMPDALASRLTLWAGARSAGRSCELRLSDAVRGACALGWRRPMIVVSSELAGLLGADDLGRVVAHEHAHIARRDDWTQLAQALVTAAAGWHPAVWLIARQLDLEREAACDAHVVARTQARREYAACLARVGTLVIGMRPTRRLALLSDVARARRTLVARVERLLDDRPLSRPGPLLPAALLGAMVLAVAGSARLGPVVAFQPAAVIGPALVASSPAVVGAPATVSPAPAARRVEFRQSARERRVPVAPPRVDAPVVPPHAVAAGAMPLAPQVAVSGDAIAGGVPPADGPVPLETVARDAVSIAVPVAETRQGEAAAPEPADALPSRILAGGLRVGRTSKAAGASIGRFFTRAAKSTALSFTNP
jgi:beta-lactamase regulating signal transducer with metallopeptidase domain